MSNKEWIDRNVKAKSDGAISIECGHNDYVYSLDLGWRNPPVYLMLCTVCYRNLFVYLFDKILDKVRW
jgi:hypothetical protein